MFATGNLVWVADKDECFVGCKVVQSFGPGKCGAVVKLEGEGHVLDIDEVASRSVLRMDEQSLGEVANMVEMKELNEASILHNLRTRFRQDLIYTNVGSILIAVNPFKLLTVYSPEVLERYRLGCQSPHIYAVAEKAYKGLIQDRKHQSCVISGESGSGKTELAKIFMQYLSEVSIPGDCGENEGGINEAILKANPLLEQFGNSKTVRNNNSSRFGKWIDILFDANRFCIIGATISSYLLEKSRIVHQSPGERNYHVFYTLCTAVRTDKKLQELLQLEEAEKYHYLNQSGKVDIDGLNEAADWDKLLTSMQVMDISHDCFKILAGVLHLGNVTFTDAPDAVIENRQVLNQAASLLGLNHLTLQKALCSRMMGVRSMVVKPYTKLEAAVARDALAKAIYSSLFEWLIRQINSALAQHDGSLETVSIGVLDIFGFESFKVNSFEQLCINYCNEALQMHFNQHIFQMEQAEYAKEQVDVSSIPFIDNEPCVRLLEAGKGLGVFSLIDEEINVPQGSDSGFLRKVVQLPSNDYVKRASMKDPNSERSFTINHYAGPVSYNVEGFIEKNKDSLHVDLKCCLELSENELIQQWFSVAEATPRTRISSKKQNATLGMKFKLQLTELMSTINTTCPHFVRCIKPNSEKVANYFDSAMVLSQLQYAGVLQVCTIRKVGFPIRLEFDAFLKQYGPISNSSSIETLCETLVNKSILTDWSMGLTKVFLRNSQLATLENARENSLFQVVAKLQAQCRGYIGRLRYASFMEIISNSRNAKSIEDIRMALNACEDLPHQNLEIVYYLKKNEQLLIERERLVDMLMEATGSLDAACLANAISKAEPLLEDSNEVLKAAKKAMLKVERAKTLRLELDLAMEGKDLNALGELLHEAYSVLQWTNDVKVHQAESMKTRLESELKLVEELRNALENNVEKLDPLLYKVNEMGLQHPLVDVALQTQVHLETIHEAMSKRNLSLLQQALVGLSEDQRPIPATSLLKELESEAELERAISSESIGDVSQAMESLTPSEFNEELLLKADHRLKVLKSLVLLQDSVTEEDTTDTEKRITDANVSLETSMGALTMNSDKAQLLEKLNDAVRLKNVASVREVAKVASEQKWVDIYSQATNIEENMTQVLSQLSECVEVSQVERIAAAGYKDNEYVIHALRVARKCKISPSSLEDFNLLLEECRSAGLDGFLPQVRRAMEDAVIDSNIIQELEDALGRRDMSTLASLLPKVDHETFSNPKLLAVCQTALQRGTRTAAILNAIELAVEIRDLDGLDSAMNDSITTGIQIPNEELVKQVKHELELQRTTLSVVVAETKCLKGKLLSGMSVSEDDVGAVSAVLGGKDTNAFEVVAATKCVARANLQLKLQKQLLQAIDTQTFSDLCSAIDCAVENDLEHMVLVVEARNCLQNSKDVVLVGREISVENVLNPDEEKNSQRRELARNLRFDFTKYHRIRPDSDFTKGVLLHKSRCIRHKLIHQSFVINKSLILHENNKDAVNIHKSLLGYCGDKSISFPAAQGFNIIEKAVTTCELADETYLQLCKHLTLNSSETSVTKGWQLMCICLGAFLPSTDFEMFLVNFLVKHCDASGSISNYAVFALSRLESNLNGSNLKVPSMEDIKAYEDRPPVLANVRLVDGTLVFHHLAVTPDLNVAQVNELCCRSLNLKDIRQSHFGLTLVGNLPLRGSDFIELPGEFIFQRIVVLSIGQQDDPSEDDPVYERLVYIQAVNEFNNGAFSSVSTVEEVDMAALIIAMDVSNGNGSIENMHNSSADFLDQVKVRSSDYANMEKSSLQNKFMKIARSQPEYGVCSFDTANRGPLTVSCQGVAFEGHKYSFTKLYRWGGSSSQFSLVLNTESNGSTSEITFDTKQASYIGGLVLQYISSILTLTGQEGGR